MALVALKCPHCAGNIELDETREFGFCMYCGSKVMIQKEVNVFIDTTEKRQEANLMPIIRRSYQDGNISETLELIDKVIDAGTADADIWAMRGMCLWALLEIEFWNALTTARHNDALRGASSIFKKKKYSSVLNPRLDLPDNISFCFNNYKTLSGTRLDHLSESFKIFKLWADNGYWWAQKRTALHYALGVGTNVSKSDAIYYYLKFISNEERSKECKS